jgi:hypothetical protein
MNSNLAVLIIASLSVLLVVAFFLIYQYGLEIKDLEKAIEDHKVKYQRFDGETTFCDYGKYSLQTFDGGATWYAVSDYHGRLNVMGPAEIVYPGLIKFINDLGGVLQIPVKIQ